jgi:hypothetical protein
VNGRHGERQLLAGLLLQALEDARRGGRHAVDALAWIDFDQGGTFTFKWTCLYLDLDPAMVRKAVLPGRKTERAVGMNPRPRPLTDREYR